MRIVVAGGTGFIGQALVRELAGAGHEVVALSRRTSAAGSAGPARIVTWDARTPGAWCLELRDAGAVVNLAGASIGAGRWTAARKRTLELSRTESTGALVAAVTALGEGDRPGALVNASGIDFYGDRGDEPINEDSAPGESFLARLCVAWESAVRAAEPLGVRVALMRTSLVIGQGADALQRLALPFKLFAGGPLGGGRQWFPWIHLDDAIGLYRLACENPAASGPINLVAPDIRRERDVAKAVGEVLGRPSWVPAPAFALRLALGEMADLVLHGRRAEPRKALALRYKFKYPRLEGALQEALR